MLELALDLFGRAVKAPPPATAVAHLVPDVAAAPNYTHARANRRGLLAGVLVEYELRRSHRRRTIGLSVGPEGLTVSAPHWTSQAEIDAALRERARWIATRLHQARERAARLAAARIDWRMGTAVPYLGAPIQLAAGPPTPKTLGDAVLDPPGPDASQPRTLHLPLPPDATPAQWRDAAQSWLMRQGRRLFTTRLDYYAPQLGVRWQRLSLSSAQTRWGSASTAGWIRLNWRLIHFGLPVIDYVVVHELAHLREMNHTPRFWAHVEGVLPDHGARRAVLRETVLPQW
jgi:predicted metal-dependent hydrolase